MSVYKTPRSQFYQYDFQYAGKRYCGSTPETEKRAAEKWEADLRSEIKAAHKDAAARAVSGAENPSDLDFVIEHYWTNKVVAGKLEGASDIRRDLDRLKARFGATSLITAITTQGLLEFRAERAADRVTKPSLAPDAWPFIGPDAVNKTIVVRPRALMTYARTVLKVRFGDLPDWKTLKLKGAKKKPRRIRDEQMTKLEDGNARDDFAAVLSFAEITGWRMRECLIRWEHVDWEKRRIRRQGKGDREITARITDEIAALLRAAEGDHPDFVFCYTCRRPLKGTDQVKGRKYPITREGLKTRWRRVKKKAGVSARFHDLRHRVGFDTLEKTGNPYAVKEKLGHADVKTTLIYLDLDNEQLVAAEERMARERRERRMRARSVTGGRATGTED